MSQRKGARPSPSYHASHAYYMSSHGPREEG